MNPIRKFNLLLAGGLYTQAIFLLIMGDWLLTGVAFGMASINLYGGWRDDE